jgi:hypothetical protein
VWNLVSHPQGRTYIKGADINRTCQRFTDINRTCQRFKDINRTCQRFTDPMRPIAKGHRKGFFDTKHPHFIYQLQLQHFSLLHIQLTRNSEEIALRSPCQDDVRAVKHTGALPVPAVGTDIPGGLDSRTIKLVGRGLTDICLQGIIIAFKLSSSSSSTSWFFAPNPFRLQTLKPFRPSFCHTSLTSSILLFVPVQWLRSSFQAFFPKCSNFFWHFLLMCWCSLLPFPL